MDVMPYWQARAFVATTRNEAGCIEGQQCAVWRNTTNSVAKLKTLHAPLNQAATAGEETTEKDEVTASCYLEECI